MLQNRYFPLHKHFHFHGAMKTDYSCAWWQWANKLLNMQPSLYLATTDWLCVNQAELMLMLMKGLIFGSDDVKLMFLSCSELKKSVYLRSCDVMWFVDLYRLQEF